MLKGTLTAYTNIVTGVPSQNGFSGVPMLMQGSRLCSSVFGQKKIFAN
jgi:hypothetical protein